jgi:hypothetical protein
MARLKKTMKNFNQDSQCPNQLPTQTPPPHQSLKHYHYIKFLENGVREWGGSETDMEDKHAGIQEHVPEKEPVL